MKKVDLAWAAGLIDGEGCIHISRNNGWNVHPNHRLVLVVHMTSKATIHRMRAIFKMGAIHCKSRLSKGGFEIWGWQAVSTEAYKILKLLYPYLITKKQQAKIGMDFVNNCLGEKKNWHKLSDRVLKKRDSYYYRLKKSKTK